MSMQLVRGFVEHFLSRKVEEGPGMVMILAAAATQHCLTSRPWGGDSNERS